MNRGNRKIAMVMLAILVVFVAACGNNDSSKGKREGDKLKVVTSFYPLYDFATKIGGEHIEVVNLVPAGVDAHDWTPKPQDMVNITQSDLFLYNGAGFEAWTDNVLSSLDKGANVLEASHGLDLLPASGDHDHDHHDHEHADDHEHDHAHEEGHAHTEDSNGHGAYDPHVWTSPKRAMEIADKIKQKLVEIAPQHAEAFKNNYEKLLADLQQLDQSLQAAVDAGTRDYIVVSHHAYAYMAHDYGFSQLAVMGISPSAEPTVQEMREMSKFIEEHDVQYILFEELASPKVAQTLASELSIETLVFNPLEGLTPEQEAAGEDYLSLMRKNVETLATALQ